MRGPPVFCHMPTELPTSRSYADDGDKNRPNVESSSLSLLFSLAK